ncbi:TetR/AcrR family transcriptional regulator [Spirillospora sp. NPDC048911]|uniref:TetR/AcrR family transcriptional regulator n=1 Tax=Spirillospora sp. NPDC048911 TaxID=3364527 RepID=UPI00371A548C
MPRAKLRTPELRDRVLRAAMTMLAEEGVTAFTARKVAQGAGTSVPAVYELFGDKAGLVREIFFEGFRRLRRRLEEDAPTDDPRADLVRVVQVFRAFVLENPVLAEVMFARPFAEFDPGAEDLRSAAAVRGFFVGGVERCVAAGRMSGDPTDAAHVLLALAQGMAAQETAGWLGTSQASADRRWDLAIRAVIDGFAPGSADPSG